MAGAGELLYKKNKKKNEATKENIFTIFNKGFVSRIFYFKNSYKTKRTKNFLKAAQVEK